MKKLFLSIRHSYGIAMLISLITTTASAQPKHYLGGDISLLPSYEEQGTVYKDYDGQKVSLLPFLK